MSVKRLGRYEILEEAGRGGFAVVYKARDPDLDRVVALKVLAPHLTWEPSFARRFRLEAQAAANLRHPHIVTIHEVGEDAGQLYIAMEYLPGRTLEELLQAEGTMSLDRALPILEQIADALDYAHDQGVIHRDVKPRNVMVEENGRGETRATLMDFGLVKAMESSESLTSAGTILGTPEYMAPEQADLDCRSEIGPASDRYALGVVAYKMLTGRVPFVADSPLAVLRGHAEKAPSDPRGIREDLPVSVSQVLLKALAKKPANRYPTAAAFVRALTIAAEGSIGVEVPTIPRERRPSLIQQSSTPLVRPQHRVLIDEYLGKELFRSRHRQQLKSSGFECVTVKEAYSIEQLSGFDVLALWFTRYFDGTVPQFSQDELSMIEGYLARGGNAFLIGLGWVWAQYEKRPVEEYPLNLIADEYGVFFTEATISSVAGVHYKESPITFSKPFMKEHPITQGVNIIGSPDSMPGSLIVEPPAIPMVWGSNETQDYDGVQNPIVLAASDTGRSRIVCLQHCGYVTHFGYDNFTLLENILTWLVGK